MAREDALSIYVDNLTKDKLAEIYGSVIEAVQKGAISEQIKNKNYSGDPTSGSVEIDRFKNATVNNLGTARTSGEGNFLTNNGKVTINVDTDKEIVEEIAKKDIKLYGLDGIAEKRKANHIKRMIAYLDTEFFAKAEVEGTSFSTAETNIEDVLEALIQSVETTQNDWVDGVDRDMIVMTLTPRVYGKLNNYIDKVPNSITGLTDELFHKVRIFSNHRQTKDAICMIDGAIGQLVTTDEYEAEKIPLSNDIALELFFSKGTKAVMPDLIKYITTVSTNDVTTVIVGNDTSNPVIADVMDELRELNVDTVAGVTNIGDTVISIGEIVGTGNSFVYKTGTKYQSFNAGDILDGYIEVPVDGAVNVATAGHNKITVAEVDADGKAVGRGTSVLNKKAE